MLVARTSDAPDPKRKHVGLSSFLIEKPRGTLPPGVKGSPIPKIGYFGWKTWELAFDNFEVPAANLLGGVSSAMKGFQDALETINMGNSVTTFTASDFNRTYDSNGRGSDHGWRQTAFHSLAKQNLIREESTDAALWPDRVMVMAQLLGALQSLNLPQPGAAQHRVQPLIGEAAQATQ